MMTIGMVVLALLVVFAVPGVGFMFGLGFWDAKDLLEKRRAKRAQLEEV